MSAVFVTREYTHEKRKAHRQYFEHDQIIRENLPKSERERERVVFFTKKKVIEET
jgi:hypothetical protein